MRLQQHSKSNYHLCAGHTRLLFRRLLLSIQQAERCGDQRQKRHGCVLPHRSTPIKILQPIGVQQIQNAAQQGCFIMAEHLTKTIKRNTCRQHLHSQHIQLIRKLYTYAQHTQNCREVQAQFSVKQRGGISIPVFCLTVDPYRELSGFQPLGNSLNAGKMKMDIVAKNTTTLHQHRHTGQQHSTAQQEKTPTQIRISDCQRAGRQKQQQQQIQKKRCQQPSQYTHPGIDPILLYRHFAKRENAAAIIGHQTDRLVCITHIQYNGIMRPPYCKKLTFARHYHCVICHKINAGMGFLLVFILRRYKIIVCFDFIVTRRQP